MTRVDRSRVVSSFTIIKGSLIDETYAVFRSWDFDRSKLENLKSVRDGNTVAGTSSHWVRDVVKVINRRYDPDSRDRPLVELAKSALSREAWRPVLLFHMTRDEFLVRDFLGTWLYQQYEAGTYRVRKDDVLEYLDALSGVKDIEWSGSWTRATADRVAAGLLKIAVDFGLLTGSQHKEFASYHLPDESFLYLLHALMDSKGNARAVLDSQDWRMFFMDASEVERGLLRLHQYRKLHFESAGSLAQLTLPHPSAAAYARELCA